MASYQPSPPDTQSTCAFCNKPSDDLKRCGGCRSVYYCVLQGVPAFPLEETQARMRDSCFALRWQGRSVPGRHCKAALHQNQDGKDIPTESPPSIPRALTTPSQDVVVGVKILDNDAAKTNLEKRFAAEIFKPDHPIFARGELCPLTAVYGIPIILHRTRFPYSDNQPAVYLRIEASDGFAPFHWQIDYNGICYAVRKDRQPLHPELLETMYEFHSSLLSRGYFEEPVGRRAYQITPKVYRKFSNEYWQKQKQFGRVSILASDGME
ncbi:hypothetical protein NLJ89_g10094 [Agrocybe chaxingu]|uniref:Uncharacterized protein n=1 Tax=Agrocybe chaxingu TaxID=84603 RepID=A0A9W8JYT7_9AGAR|nr:hypothetical protein NLJ89_g10094 [Agrocybe chaxingu]